MKVILETERLLLREYVQEDAEAFFKLNSDPEVLRFVPDKRLPNVEQARQILIDHPIADTSPPAGLPRRSRTKAGRFARAKITRGLLNREAS
jgi:Acetyltransferase (GNAT) domain